MPPGRRRAGGNGLSGSRAPRILRTRRSDALVRGYELGVERLDQTLEEFNAREIRCQGEMFDPRRMNAIESEESAAVPPGTVLDVYRGGYEWNGEVFRTAQVKVARAPKQESMSDLIVGIDLGTTNSEVAAFLDGQVRVLGPGDQRILPSCVGFSESGELLVGEPARNQQALYPERTVRSIKRRMGSAETRDAGREEFHAARDLRGDPSRTGGLGEPLAGRTPRKGGDHGSRLLLRRATKRYTGSGRAGRA